jgi:hypothetical protein
LSNERTLGYRASQSDLDNEKTLKQFLEAKWSCTLHELPHLYHVDFYAERDNKLVAWVEVKQRSTTSYKYPTVFLNKDKKYKYLRGLSFSEPALFVVRWADGVTKYIDVANVQEDWLSYGGENNRWGPGENDYEAVYEIPINEMLEVGNE